MPARLLEYYRGELAGGCPEAGDDGLFYPAALAAHASWLIGTLAGSLEHSLVEDESWGISTIRQHHHMRLGLFADAAGAFPALAAAAREMAGRLRERWHDLEEMPLYAPFR